MTHSPRRLRGTTARIATTAAAAALLAAATTGVATAQSVIIPELFIPTVAGSVASGSAGLDPTTQRATTTHDNLTITQETIGGNTGLWGDQIHLRTTISATDGPARQVTRIEGSVADRSGCYHHWTDPKSGTVTYTNAAGERVTDSLPYADLADNYTAVGSWTVDPAEGTTVVYDNVREFTLEVGGAGGLACPGEPVVTKPYNMVTGLVVDVDGLDRLDWNPTGVELTCTANCVAPNPAGSADMGSAVAEDYLDAIFGS